jgi:hypothetical protein
MKYFKVKAEADQKRPSVRFKTSFLVKDELYTESEVKRAINRGWINEKFSSSNLESIECKPKDTYFCFGARFKVSAS